MKWMEGEKEGIVVADSQGQGNGLTQLPNFGGVIIDQLGTVYGNVIAGGNGQGGESNQLNAPNGLSFDGDGNLYVVDWGNHRVQKFNIEFNG
ncbi:unnamed protein product [Rotaria magnacalcarata]|uniref:Uncharacterized protein n=1 Tax=Rotaria magnacalcarata TaxID=392030 RepID=A0A817A592_9BILA|nr:unnamed protein product [Rotaria magnacalcarata]